MAEFATCRRGVDADGRLRDPGPCICTGRGEGGGGGLCVHERTAAVVSVQRTSAKRGRALDRHDGRCAVVHIDPALGRWGVVSDPTDRGPGL